MIDHEFMTCSRAAWLHAMQTLCAPRPPRLVGSKRKAVEQLHLPENLEAMQHLPTLVIYPKFVDSQIVCSTVSTLVSHAKAQCRIAEWRLNSIYKIKMTRPCFIQASAANYHAWICLICLLAWHSRVRMCSMQMAVPLYSCNHVIMMCSIQMAIKNNGKDT